MSVLGHEVCQIWNSTSNNRCCIENRSNTEMVWDIRKPYLESLPGVTPALISTSFLGHEDSICSLDFSPSDYSIFGSSSEDGSVRIWDMRCPNSSILLNDSIFSSPSYSDDDVGTLRFSPTDGNRLFVSRGMVLFEFDVKERRIVRTIDLRASDELRMKIQGMSPSLTPDSDTNDDDEKDVINDFDISNCGRYVCMPIDSGYTIVCDLSALTNPRPPVIESQLSEKKKEVFRVMNSRHDNICGCGTFGRTDVIFTGG